MFQTKFVEKIKTHILCSVTFFFFEKLAVYEIMWQNIVELDRPQLKIWRLRIACWISKVTNSTAAVVTRTRLNIALYIHCLFVECYNWRYTK